jgi:ferredoxin-NADP reductase/predicted pyridoxine 5'-phosphate oxidase superfamily flavin-nucleotide-binding protein
MSKQASVESPFHAGEQAVQERLGVRADIEPWARKVVLPFLPDQHREFYAALPFLVVAARDEEERPWATLLAGPPGFLSTPDSETLSIRAEPTIGDALHGKLAPGTDVGVLGIEFATRRRNRMNGRVRADATGAVVLQVDQSFGNCPQYITEREWQMATDTPSAPVQHRHARLDGALAARIRAADTFFIATGHRGVGESETFGMDASHRGGPPGFVDVVDDRTLVFPDYAGNNHFNTIGNLELDPRAGLVFVDFATGDMLQLTGRVQIDWDSEEVARHPGARRLVRFRLDEAVLLESALPVRWVASSEPARPLRLVEKTRETDDVISFVFQADDDGPLAAFEAGQHLPIELGLPDRGEPVTRTYSLSNARGSDRYRISVKRETHGAASRHLHDAIAVGDVIPARRPAGEFVLAPAPRPVMLVSAGIGATPMVSMLHAIAAESEPRAAWYVHGARDGRHHAFADEVRALASESRGVKTHVSFSRPLPEDQPGRDFDAEGRVTGELLSSLLPDLDVEFYLCGPIPFMAELQSELEQLGVPPERIHSESFGPA